MNPQTVESISTQLASLQRGKRVSTIHDEAVAGFLNVIERLQTHFSTFHKTCATIAGAELYPAISQRRYRSTHQTYTQAFTRVVYDGATFKVGRVQRQLTSFPRARHNEVCAIIKFHIHSQCPIGSITKAIGDTVDWTYTTISPSEAPDIGAQLEILVRIS